MLFVSTRFALGAQFVPPAPTAVSDDAMLSAIAEVETGNNAAKRGHHGERTQLQIMPTTWREFSRLPHSASATHPQETERVAKAYLAVIRKNLRARGLPETPFFIAAGWNAGAGWKRLHPSTVSYAERVANLVQTFEPAAPVPTRSTAPDQPTFGPRLNGPEIALHDLLMHSANRSSLVAHTADIPIIDVGASN